MVASHLLLMNHFFMSLTHNSPEVGAFSDFNSVIVDVGCPIGCTHCSPINGCLACKPPFFLMLQREGTRQTASCTTTCPSGFYKLKKKRNGFCTKCTMRGCTDCLAVHYCSVCDPEFVNFFGKCIKQPTDKELEELGVFVTRPPYTTTSAISKRTRPTEPSLFISNDSTPAANSETSTPPPVELDTRPPSASTNTTAAENAKTTTSLRTAPEGGETRTPSAPSAPPLAVPPGAAQPTRSDGERCRRKYTRKKGRRRGERERNGQKGRRRGRKRRRHRKKNNGRRGGGGERKQKNRERHQRRRCRRRKKSRRGRPGFARRPSESPVYRDSGSSALNATALGELNPGSRAKQDLDNPDLHRVREIKLSLLEKKKKKKKRRTRRPESQTFFYKNRPLAMVEYKQSRAHKQAKPLRVSLRRLRHGRRPDRTREA